MRKMFFLNFVLICFFFSVNLLSVDSDSILSHTLHYSETDYIPLIIVLDEQLNLTYDIIYLRSLAKNYRREYAISNLKKFSEENQKILLHFLENYTSAKNIRCHWLANAVSFELPKKELTFLKTRDEIRALIHDPIVKSAGYVNRSKIDIDKEDTLPYHLEILNVSPVWEKGIHGEDVLVAVVDSGINYNHQDLAGRMWESDIYPFHGYNFVHDNYDTMDLNGHGTHCAGIVAGTGSSGVTTGVAPSAKLMSVVVLNETLGSNNTRILQGIEFALDNGADVLSLSIGMGSGLPDVRYLYRQFMDNILAIGVPTLAAAGNDGFFLPPFSVILPAACPPPWLHPDQFQTGGISGSIAIGALDEFLNPAGFTSRGPSKWIDIAPYYDYNFDLDEFFLDPYNPDYMGLIRPDVSAAGVDVISLNFEDTEGYLLMSGTSMAAPAAAGVTALMLSVNPELTPEEVVYLLENNAHPLTDLKDNFVGSGCIDAYNTILALKPKIDIPYFLPESGVYKSQIYVEILSENPFAFIHYTLDETEPDLNSALYTKPLLIKEDTIIKARAYLSDSLYSDIATASYIIDTSHTSSDYSSHISLFNAFPNPVNSRLTVSLGLLESTNIKLSFFNVKGQLIETIKEEEFHSGKHSLRLDLESRKHLSSGIYFLRLESKDHILTEKILIMR